MQREGTFWLADGYKETQKTLDTNRQLMGNDIVSGGFATVQPGSKLSINAVEGYPLEDFSPEV